jgi:hypothetical protein
MRQKLETAVYAQGWMGSQIQSLVEAYASSEDENVRALSNQLAAMWVVLDETMDDIIRENLDLRSKLAAMRNVVGYDDLKAQITAAIKE